MLEYAYPPCFIDSWVQIAGPAFQMRRTFTFLPFTFPADSFFTA